MRGRRVKKSPFVPINGNLRGAACSGLKVTIMGPEVGKMMCACPVMCGFNDTILFHHSVWFKTSFGIWNAGVGY